MASLLSSLALLSLLLNLVNSVSSELVLEDGYTVTTAIDGHKLNINPYSVIASPGSSDLFVLDSSNSVFYTLSLPLSQESVVKRLSGDGVAGFSDGEPGSARFNKPKRFTVDMKGNVYVADQNTDKNKNVIRKITNSGVTTIAGGFSKKAGRADGPGQNASFSSSFELTFVPQICALLISDHGNQLIRQINLKPEDCARSSPSGPALGAVSVWVLVLGLILSCLLGLVIGFFARPYITPHEGSNHCFSGTWRHYQINLVRQVQTICFDIRSATASSTLYALLKRLFWLSLSHLSLIFRINTLESRNPKKDVISLLDSDDVRGCEIKKSQVYANQLKDLTTFDRNQDLLSEDILKQGYENEETSDVFPNSHGILDGMIQANIRGFAGEAKETTPEVGSLMGNSGLVKRR